MKLSPGGLAVSLRRSGYNLIEVVLAMTVIVVVSALAIPFATSMWADSHMTSAGDMIRARWVEARNLAVEQGRPYRFAFQENTGKYRIAPDAEEFWGTDTPQVASSDSPGPLITIDGELPEGISFSQADTAIVSQGSGGGGAWTQPVVFRQDGSLSEDYRLGYGKAGQRPSVLRLRAMTGSVSSEETK